MIIGVPRERKILEKRVALTPDGVSELVQRGHSVLIEKDAGAGSFFEDAAYVAAGGTIADSLQKVWSAAELVVKVKEPDPAEYEFFRPGLLLFDYLHLASMRGVTEALLKGGVRSFAYELVQTSDRRLPLLEPMSEVAGKLSVLNGSYFLLSQNGGRGILPGGVLGVAPAEVVIIGAGIAGRAACEMALGIGARVTLLDVDPVKLDRVKLQFGAAATTLFSSHASIEREALKADLLIGAVLIPGAAAPKLLSKKIISQMKKGAVFVDISIDQGGCAETIRPTTLEHPVFVESGVVHYGVCNMPAQTPRTSTLALTAATLPYIIKIAQLGAKRSVQEIPELEKSVSTWDGKLTCKAVGETFGIEYVSATELI